MLKKAMIITGMIMAKWVFFFWGGGDLGVLRPNTWLIFHIDLPFRPFYRSRCHQGLSLILPSGDFPGESGAVPFQDVIYDKYLIKIRKQNVILLKLEWRTRWWRFCVDTVNGFWDIDLLSWKITDSQKIWHWLLITGSHFDLGSKNAHQSRVLMEGNPPVISAKLYGA